MALQIRNAERGDISDILKLLRQVNLVHHNGRPDLFELGVKYSADEIKGKLGDGLSPILVAAEDGCVKGYAFCIIIRHSDSISVPHSTLYIDDFCVDESCRRQGVGSKLFAAVTALAKERGCHNITLNAWTLNPAAIKFYESLGMSPQKICMEKLID